MNSNFQCIKAIAALCLLFSAASLAQTTVSEDFTGTSTTNAWYTFNGACLTAGNTNLGAAFGSAGQVPGCNAIQSSYYNEHLVGGQNGAAGPAQTLPDPDGSGALRFTNGCIPPNGTSTSCSSGGHAQNGVIVSGTTFDAGAGVQITFKTVSYRGDSGGNGSSCPSGSTYSNGQCLITTTIAATATVTTTYSCPHGYTLSGSTCSKTTAPTKTTTTTYSCPSGYSLSGSTCSEAATATTTYSCKSGYTLSGSNCYECPAGYTLNATDTECTETGEANKTPTHTVATATTTYSCPAGDTITGSGAATTCTLSAAATTTTAYTCPSGYTASGSGASTQCTETVTATATNTTTYSCPAGYTLSGSQCSQSTVSEVSAAHQNDGADGISFFLMDGSQPVTFGSAGNYGSWGGSLGYSCSNANPPYNGLVGAYIGLGIDEYGNFLNGTTNTLGVSGITTSALGDNTASGGGQWANRIGLRGAGNVAWNWLNSNYPTYYPSTLTSAQQQSAVQASCKTGTLWNYSTPSAPTNTGSTTASNGPTLLDYAAIPNAYSVLSGVTIANEYATGGYARSNATPITYKLQLTQNGLLSLWYSVNGGSWLNVLSGQSITASNGTIPSTLRFGFAGSTGGSSNIHEVLCFRAAPATQSASSAAANEKQSAQIQTGAQAYFAYYNPDDWTGRLTANTLSYNSSGQLVIAATANWDASCVLTGVASSATCATTGVAGPVSAQDPASRTVLTWGGSSGIPFHYEDLNTTQQSQLTASAAPYWSRVAYLRGDRSDEINSQGAGLYRARDSVLADIVDSSPVWVGPPQGSYPAAWVDQLYPTSTPAENSGQSYPQYVSTQDTRQNVVYVGANDGLVHGFQSGAFSSSGSWLSATNNGYEVLAYMPSAVVGTIHNASNPQLDYSNAQYGHNFYADATPGVGDLFYAGAWHTWLVSGLGPGGADIFALDITNPSNFSEGNASSLVLGDWNPSTLTCLNVPNCGSNLGNTYGSPIIRRLHNGDWAVIFGNGFGSSTGDAGVYIMTVDPNTAATTFYYLSTGESGNNDGIAYVTSADLDGDNIVDYLYAGDLLGNVWRFNLTSNNPAVWNASAAPLFTTSSGQPITTKLMVVGMTNSAFNSPQIMVAFGTGQKIPLTNTSPTAYASGAQTLYAFWDWKLNNWDAKSSVQYASLSSAASGLAAPYTLTPANLQLETMTIDSSGNRDINSAVALCWQSTNLCSSGNDIFGWYLPLPGTDEQIIYNPEILSSVFLVNSVVPANNSPLSCSSNLDTGFTYAISMLTGGAVGGFFVNPNSNSNITASTTSSSSSTSSASTSTVAVAGMQTNATGTSFVVGSQAPAGPPASPAPGGGGSSCSQKFLVYQTISGTANSVEVAPPCNALGKRLTWAELR